MAVIDRLWDDAEFESEHRRLALAEAGRWARWDDRGINFRKNRLVSQLGRAAGAVSSVLWRGCARGSTQAAAGRW